MCQASGIVSIGNSSIRRCTPFTRSMYMRLFPHYTPCYQHTTTQKHVVCCVLLLPACSKKVPLHKRRILPMTTNQNPASQQVLPQEGRAAIYTRPAVRVLQTPQPQTNELEAYAKAHGYSSITVFEERHVAGNAARLEGEIG